MKSLSSGKEVETEFHRAKNSMVRHRVVKDDLRSVRKKIIEMAKSKVTRARKLKETCVALICAICIRRGLSVCCVWSMVHNLLEKHLSASVLLSIPRRVCRARVSRSNSHRGEKLHRRITPERPSGLTLSEPDKNISFNA